MKTKIHIKTRGKHIDNTTIGTSVLFASMIVASIWFLSGCSMTGMERSEKTGVTMSEVQSDINKAVIQVNVTNTSLQDLVMPGQSNVKKSFKKYSDNVDTMEKQGKRLLQHTDKMSAQGKEYFEEWQTQGDAYTNPDIQALSEQRRADLSAVFAGISGASVGVKGAFKAYMSDIKEIETYLSNDLTPKGVESITSVADKAIADGENLKSAVEPVLDAIGSAKAEFATGGAGKERD